MSNIDYTKIIGGLSLAMVLAGSTGCESTKHDERSEGRVKDDKNITETVEKGLKKEAVYKFDNVSVKTFAGAVQLSGFVNTEEQKNRAQEVAEAVPGVNTVVNGLTIKQFTPSPTGRTLGTAEPRIYADPPTRPAEQNATAQQQSSQPK